MPTYDFRCTKCGLTFEELTPMSVKSLDCPECGQRAERKFTANQNEAIWYCSPETAPRKKFDGKWKDKKYVEGFVDDHGEYHKIKNGEKNTGHSGRRGYV